MRHVQGDVSDLEWPRGGGGGGSAQFLFYNVLFLFFDWGSILGQSISLELEFFLEQLRATNYYAKFAPSSILNSSWWMYWKAVGLWHHKEGPYQPKVLSH
jgi:hypothetical protein